MFIALDVNGNRISIENATKDSQYFCPICGEPLTIRATNSLAVKTHFAHKRGTICYDDWTHDMSEWHLSWQQRFPEQYREVVIEKNGIKHRADICIGNTVIEFQHSPITREEIAKRNLFYISCGYQVVWVFDATDKIINRIEDSIDPMKCRMMICAGKEQSSNLPSKRRHKLRYICNIKLVYQIHNMLIKNLILCYCLQKYRPKILSSTKHTLII